MATAIATQTVDAPVAWMLVIEGLPSRVHFAQLSAEHDAAYTDARMGSGSCSVVPLYADSERDVAVANMRAIDAERLALVEELRQEREKRQAFEDALVDIATNPYRANAKAEAVLREHLPHAVDIQPAPAVAQGGGE